MKQLLVAHDYPPILGAEAIQSSRMVKYLNSFGISTTVLTRSAQGEGSDIRSCETVVRSKTYESKLLKGALYLVSKDLLNCPDTKFTWIRGAAKAGEELLRTQPFDFVHSWSSPLSSHLAVLKMRAKRNFKWIAHFSDPWTDNPYIAYRTDRVKSLNLGWERAVFENADILTFTSEETVDLVMRKYGDAYRSKVKVLPHTYDPEAVARAQSAAVTGNARAVVSHVGNFYGKRVPDDLFRGIVKAKSLDSNIGSKLEVRLIGRIDDKYKSVVRQMGLSDIVVFQGVVSYQESQRLMAESDVLLNVDASDDVSVFLPSKLVEYIAYDKPILALTPEKGTTARVLKQHGHTVIENGNHDVLAAYLTGVANRTLEMTYDRTGQQLYHPERIAGDFAGIARQLVEGPGV